MRKRQFVWKSWGTWVTIGVLSGVWWYVAGQGSLQRRVLIAWLSLSSFMVGALVGFLFSSYGEESSSLGKIRDWLVGVITALTVAKASSIKGVLGVFAAGPGPVDFAYAAGASVFYAGLGFFFMFFQRELILNILLAQSRAQRGRLEGSQQAGQVIQRLLLRLPASLLSGVDYIDQVPDMNEEEVKQLRSLLYKDEVETYLNQAEEAAKSGSVDWDIASKTAYVLYYRTYFEKKNTALIDRALEWVTRTLNMNPLHSDLTMRYADLLGMQEDYQAAATVLERLALRSEAPALVRQWLGYYLRFDEDRLDDAIRYSEDYIKLFPSETDSLFNIAYAYLRKYCKEGRLNNEAEAKESHEKALGKLQDALRSQPDMKPRVAEWIEDDGLVCIKGDDEFRKIAGLPTSKSSGAADGSTKNKGTAEGGAEGKDA